MKRWAVPLRAFTHADEAFEEGKPVKIEAGHLRDWSASGVDLVRGASPAESKAAKAALGEAASDDDDQDDDEDVA